MPDWTLFHQALVSGTRSAELAGACAQAWRWLDLPGEQQRREIDAAIASEAAAKWTLEGLPLLRRRLWRDAGFDPEDTAKLGMFLEKFGAGGASPEHTALLRRMDSTVAIGRAIAERFPSAATSSGAADRAALMEHVPALSEAVQATGLGVASPESLERLRAVIDGFTPLGTHVIDEVRREHAWWLGLAWWALERGLADGTRYDEAVDAFERSASWYDSADDVKSAADTRKQLRALRVRLAGNLDAAVAPAARALLAAREPWSRASALAALLRDVGGSGDRFEAGRLADEAASALDEAGFPDPEPAFHAAIEHWIATASAAHSGNALFARLCQAAEHWAAILAARASARLDRDPLASARSERVLRGLAAFPDELETHAQEARRASLERLAVWLPLPAAAPPPAAPLEGASARDAAVAALDAMARLDADLHDLRIACNEGPDPSLTERALVLRRRAESIGSRVHIARAILEQAYVLLAVASGRAAAITDVPALADSAIGILLAGHPARLGSFATGYERELYLSAIDYKARALAARRDADAIITLCEPVIHDIESERRRVTAPYQQSAFLATRTGLYEVVAAAAYHARREDLLLAIPELLKARATLKNLLMPAADFPQTSEAAIELRRVGDALRQAVPGSAEEAALRDRRRWLAALTGASPDRRGAADEPPTLSRSSLQAALAPDEAAVSWFWAASDVLLVHAITNDASAFVRVELDATHQKQLRECIACVTALSGASPRYGRLVPQLDVLVAELGPVLLPQRLRELVSTRSRLVLSPHRMLHLFPFHAIQWDTGPVSGDSAASSCRLIERFATRYAPNLTSLLLPWRGVTRGPVLAIGVGHFDDVTVPTIPGAEDEAAAVARVHGPNGRTLLRPTRSAFVEATRRDYRCLHLATHGSSVLTGEALDDPLAAALYLRDGALSGWDLADLRVRAELVVLGACHSGQRAIEGRGMRSLPGDDLLGLQSVLFDAGAGAVLGALWQVDDDSAREILLAFHAAYAEGAPPDRALQAALRSYLARPDRRRDVFYWAPFFVNELGRRAGTGEDA